MKSSTLGKSTSAAEVVGISKHGVWLHVRGEEYFLSFRTFPWFREGTVASILKVKLLLREHLYWPDLHVELELESIKHPEKYPLTYRPLARHRRTAGGNVKPPRLKPNVGPTKGHVSTSL